MEPITLSLGAALGAAATALAGGVAQAAGEDVWVAAKARLTSWRVLGQGQERAAFDAAVRAALAELRRASPPIAQLDSALALLTDPSPEGRAFVQVAAEEYLFSLQPNTGRLLDSYRRNLRFLKLLQGASAPEWDVIAPILAALFSTLLPAAMAQQPVLRPLLLAQAELAALDAARAAAQAAQAGAASLQRIEALLSEMARLPRIVATVSATGGASISHTPITIVLGDQTTYMVPAISSPSLRALYNQYHSFMHSRYATLDFRGIVQMQNVVRLPIEQVYVPLQGTLRIRQTGALFLKDFFDNSGLPTSRRPSRADDQARQAFLQTDSRIPLHDLLRDHTNLVVLGEPGAGKSTLVKYVLLSLINGQAGERLGLQDEWLPIFFPVAAFAEARGDAGMRDLAPLEYLRTFYIGLSQPDYTPLFERALLIDGLDEVREDRRTIIDCLEAFIRKWDVPGNRFVATSRIAGYDDAPLDETLFVRATVQPFDDDQIRLFANRWSTAFERVGAVEPPEAALRQAAEARTAELCRDIFANPGVLSLARNPLLLTILALIHNQGTRLPNRRVDLYRLCVEALAETWNRARSLSGREIDVYLGEEKLDERFVISLLGPAALWIHEENPGGIVEERDLENRLTEILIETDGLTRGKARRLAEDFLQIVNRETGLLQERGHRRYGFLHLTFEEYLAARALLESPTVSDADAEIHRRAADPGWREVLRLALASVSQRDAQRLLLHLLAAPTDAVTRGRPIVLAAESLLDIGRKGIRHAEVAVFNALLDLIADSQIPVATRVEGGHVLGRLGDPRLLNPRTGEAVGRDEYAQVASYWCPIEAGPFWFGDERVEEEENEKDIPDAEELDELTIADTPPIGGKSITIGSLIEGRSPRFDASKLHQIELPEPFKIARYPVTNAEFARFLEANGPNGYDPTQPWWTDEGRKFLTPGGHPYDNQDEPVIQPRYWDNPAYNSPSQPVVGVSWYETVSYCRWLTLEGHQHKWLPLDQEIRLPTSLEWERAARHTDTRPFPWGDATPDPTRANYAAAEVNAPSPVGCFSAGEAACGALDLVGNVLEWMSIIYEEQQKLEPEKDFTPNVTPSLSYTYFAAGLENLCCGARYRYNPVNWSDLQGFRLIQSLRSS